MRDGGGGAGVGGWGSLSDVIYHSSHHSFLFSVQLMVIIPAGVEILIRLDTVTSSYHTIVNNHKMSFLIFRERVYIKNMQNNRCFRSGSACVLCQTRDSLIGDLFKKIIIQRFRI